MRTIGSRLGESRGFGAGFDFLRVILAFAVVTWHTPTLASGETFETTPFVWFAYYSILPMFFALSGFLIAGSAIRLSLRDFFINRGLRILPALTVEIVLSAFILGPLVTSLPLHEYFSDWRTYSYFTNVVARINYHLPGVFETNPVDLVNMSLWTVPFEFGCYAIMAVLVYFRLLLRRWVVLAIAALILAAGSTLIAAGYHEQGDIAVRVVVGSWLAGRGSVLFVTFCLGIGAYLYRDKLPYSWGLFVGSVAICLGIAATQHYHAPSPVVGILADVPLVYITAFLGVTRLPKLPLFDRGDYSYGIYLYGWPFMQAIRFWFPAYAVSSLLLWLMSVPAITLFAVFSWHVIEKPILRLRKRFSFVARVRLEQPDAAFAESYVPPASAAAGRRP